MSKVHQAINLASFCHFEQNRKAPENGHYLPYLIHPFEVLKIIWQWGVADETMSCAAILHDSIEDCSFGKGEAANLIKAGFGESVLQIVLQLTKPDNVDKFTYLKTFTDPKLTSIEALVIKLADRICNYNDFLAHDEEYAVKYMRKADILDMALRERADEINEKWNFNVMQAVVLTWRSHQLDCDSLEFELSKRQAATEDQ